MRNRADQVQFEVHRLSTSIAIGQPTPWNQRTSQVGRDDPYGSSSPNSLLLQDQLMWKFISCVCFSRYRTLSHRTVSALHWQWSQGYGDHCKPYWSLVPLLSQNAAHHVLCCSGFILQDSSKHFFLSAGILLLSNLCNFQFSDYYI